MPPDMRDGPRPVTGDRPKQIATHSINRRGPKRRDAVTCRVSLLMPAGRRTRWWYLATCPVCRAPHLGAARDLVGVTGIRRLPCGHYVVVTIARTYGRTGSGAAA
jgi:hypothetical protein